MPRLTVLPGKERLLKHRPSFTCNSTRRYSQWAIKNKQQTRWWTKETFWWQVKFFKSLVPLAGAFQCLGLSFCYCAYFLSISRYSGFLWVVPTNTGYFCAV